MRPLNEKLLIKENLSEVEFIYLPMIIEDQEEYVKCATFEDIIKGRKGL